MRSSLKLILLPALWLLATGVGPIEEGIEVGLDAGGGEYENDFGCGPNRRYRYAATHAFVKYRPEASALTLSAETSALASRMIALEDYPGQPQSTRINEPGPGRLAAAGRVGGQWRYLGFELGAGVWGDHAGVLAAPTASLRFHPAPRHTVEFGALEPATHVHPAVFSLQYLYAGEKYRAGIGVRPGQENDVWGEVGYRVNARHSLGLEMHYFEGGYFGPMGAMFVQYRWHTTKPRPANWSEPGVREP